MELELQHIPEGMKCDNCGLFKDGKEFHNYKNRPQIGKYKSCKSCREDGKLKYKYGITRKEW